MKAFFTLVSAFLFASSPLLHAQMPGAGPSGVNSILLKLFGKHNNFSVRAEMRMLDPQEQELMTIAVDMAVLDGKLRADVDTATAKGSVMTAEMIAQTKSMGMDRATSIIRPDKDIFYLIYPGLKSYAAVPLPKDAAATLKSQPKMQKTAIAKETIDGHPCIKNRVVMSDDKGRKQESFSWDATDLKDFPVQIQLVEEGNTIVIRYKNINFTKPATSLFEPPAGYTKYDDLQTMLTKTMMGAAKAAQQQKRH